MNDQTETTGTLTRFYLFKPHKEGAVDLWDYVGSHQASGRDAALRKEFGRVVPVGAVAVSETAWQPKRPKVERVVRGLEDFDMPNTPVTPEPDSELDGVPLADESTLLPRAQGVPEEAEEPAVA